MSYIARLHSKISKYIPDDYAGLVSFRRRMWPNRPGYLDDLHWEWQFLDNPGNPSSTPEIWIFKDDGQISGQQGAIPVLLKIRDTYYHCSWAIDLMVDPKFRNKGVGYLLAKELNKAADISLALGINDPAYQMYLKDGWTDLGFVPRFVKILDARPLAEKRLRVPIISWGLSHLLNLYLYLRDAKLVRRTDKYIVQINEIDHFDDHFDELWERVSQSFPLIARRDSNYLNWRYISLPGMSYKIFQMKHGGQVSGYIILRTGHESGRRVGYIVDFLVAPERLTPLIAKAVEYLREEAVTTIICYVLNKETEVMLEKLGFHRRDSNERFMIKINKPELLSEPLSNRDDWFLVRGDSDMDRP